MGIGADIEITTNYFDFLPDGSPISIPATFRFLNFLRAGKQS